MDTKRNYQKEYKDLYQPKAPALIDVPEIPFIWVDGTGAPEGDSYQEAVGILYSLCWTIKMSKMGAFLPDGYFEYVMPPLEGLWADIPGDAVHPREAWRWTSMIRQPEFVTPEVFAWALEAAALKNPDLDYGRAHLSSWREGLCAQAMHVGPFADEPATVEKIHRFIAQNQLKEDYNAATAGLARRHHEIYLSNPRRTAPEKRKTVLRLPVARV